MLTLRPYQKAAIAAIYEYYEKKSGNCCIVIPTAGGKSLVMAAFIEGVLKAWPDQRILIVTHVRELIAQNHAELIGLWPEAPAGIYSAGLGKREAGVARGQDKIKRKLDARRIHVMKSNKEITDEVNALDDTSLAARAREWVREDK